MALGRIKAEYIKREWDDGTTPLQGDRKSKTRRESCASTRASLAWAAKARDVNVRVKERIGGERRAHCRGRHPAVIATHRVRSPRLRSSHCSCSSAGGLAVGTVQAGGGFPAPVPFIRRRQEACGVPATGMGARSAAGAMSGPGS